MNANEKAIEAIAAYLLLRDESVTPDEADDDERKESAREILAALAEAAAVPPDVAGVVERALDAANAEDAYEARFGEGSGDGHQELLREAADALAPLAAENDRLRGELARVRAETVERAAETAETCAIIVPLTPGTACGASSTKRQIAAAIRSLEPRHD